MTTAVDETRRELELDPQGRIAEDLLCRACGYNLRGHAEDAQCPECAAPVALSARRDLLRLSDPDWIDRLARGMRLVLIGLIAGAIVQMAVAVIGTALMTAGSPIEPAFTAAAALLVAGASVVVVVGVWWLTTPEPARAEREAGLGARRLTRWCLAAQIAALPLQLASPTGGVGFGATGAPMGAALIALTAAGVVLWIVVLVGYGAGFVYLGRLASRIPRPALARQTRIVMWGYLASQGLAVVTGVLFLVGLSSGVPFGGAATQGAMMAVATAGCVVAAGALVFGIWALVLMFLYAAAFRRAAADAHAAWVASF